VASVKYEKPVVASNGQKIRVSVETGGAHTIRVQHERIGCGDGIHTYSLNVNFGVDENTLPVSIYPSVAGSY
jgi:hypothetical protein